MRIVIGITGTSGAGKETVVRYLQLQRKFTHYSVSGFITDEVVKRGLSVNRDTMRSVANELRVQHGVTYIVDMLYERVRTTREEEGAIIESLRALGEVQRIKKLGGVVIGVDADIDIRYKRVHARGSMKDSVTYEEFIAQEYSEMNENDPYKQNLNAALKEANFVLRNDGTIETLQVKIKDVLARIHARA